MGAEPQYAAFLVDRYGTRIKRGTEILYVVGGDRPAFYDATVVDFTDNSVMVEREVYDWQIKANVNRKIRLQRPSDTYESDPANHYRWLYDDNGPVVKPFSPSNPARLPYVIVHGTVVRRLED